MKAKNKNKSKRYWQVISEELEEAVSEDIENGIYDESKIPDLEELAMQCPYSDLAENLLEYAMRIECGLITIDTFEETNRNYIDICLGLED